MARDIAFGIKLRADGSGFVGEVRLSGEELKKFGRAARETGQEVERAGDQMAGGLTKAVAIGSTIGTVLGRAIVDVGRKLFDMTTQNIAALDDLKDTAQGLAIAPEVLSSIEMSAQRAGVGTGQLSTALTQLNRRMVDALNGGKRSVQLFDELKISVIDAAGNLRSTEDVLKDVADRFGEYATGATKSQLANELFRNSGTKLVAFLSEGRDGLTKFAGASRENIEEAAKLSDEIDKLSASWERLKLAMAGTLAAGINRGIAAFGSESENAPEKVLERINTQIERLKRELQTNRNPEFLEAINIELREAEQRAENLRRLISREQRGLLFGNEGYGDFRQAPNLDKPGRTPRERRGKLDLAGPPESVVAQQYRDQQRELERLLSTFDRYEDQQIRIAAAMQEENRRLREQNEEIGLSAFEIDALRVKRLEAAAATLEQSLALQRMAGESEAEIERTQTEIRLLREKIGLQQEGNTRRAAAATASEVERAAARSIEEQKEAAQEVGRLLGDSMIQGFQRGENVGRNFVESLGNMIYTRIAQRLSQAIIDGLSAEFAGGMGSSGNFDWVGDLWISAFGAHGGGVAGGAGTFRRGMPAGAFRGAPRYHSGGVAGEVPAILKRGEGVFTPEQMARLAPTGGVTVNVINNAGVDVQTRERADGGGLTIDVLIEQMEGAIAGNVSRGRGGLHQALESRYGLRMAAR